MLKREKERQGKRETEKGGEKEERNRIGKEKGRERERRKRECYNGFGY